MKEEIKMETTNLFEEQLDLQQIPLASRMRPET